MPLTPEDLAAKAMDLSSEARARLADLIVESLDADALGPIDRAWAQEAKRRLETFRAGQAKAVPADEAIRQVRDSVKR